MNPVATYLPEAELQSLFENKGGLEVTNYGQFGDLMIGDKQELVLWIQWVTKEAQQVPYS